MIVLLRIDGRLIHGQVIAGFSQREGAEVIMVINDAAAKNPFQKNIMKMAIPKSVRLEVVTIDDALTVLENDANRSKKVLVLVKSPIDLVKLIENGLKIDKVNVGGVVNEGANIKITNEVKATEEEMIAWKRLNELGIVLELQWESNSKKSDFNKRVA